MRTCANVRIVEGYECACLRVTAASKYGFELGGAVRACRRVELKSDRKQQHSRDSAGGGAGASLGQ
eukprot:280255-Pleurochrysis_carterae.AAC.3